MNKLVAILLWLYLITNIQQISASDDEVDGVQCVCVNDFWGNFKCILDTADGSLSLDDVNFESICGKYYSGNYYEFELLNFVSKEFPGILLKRYKRLYTLAIRNAKIQNIDSQQFEGGEYLTSLDLSYNEIRELQKNVFEHLKKIEKIDLSHNMIESIDDNSFAMNNIRSFTIDLSHNRLKNFKQEWLFKSSKEFVALIEHNEIAQLENIMINGGHGNQSPFSIAHNKLTNIELNNLTDNVSFASNEITEISCKENVERITSLNLFNNQIMKSENFYECLKKLINLQTLDLSYNNLGTEPFLRLDAFSKLSSLKYFYLAGNKFSIIPYGLFSFNLNLHFLDLSYNQFYYSFNPNALISLENLKRLNLSFSGIRSVYELMDIGKVLKNLNVLGIEGNDFSCNCLAFFILQLEKQEIMIGTPIDVIVENSNIGGIVCSDVIRYGEVYCNQN